MQFCAISLTSTLLLCYCCLIAITSCHPQQQQHQHHQQQKTHHKHEHQKHGAASANAIADSFLGNEELLGRGDSRRLLLLKRSPDGTVEAEEEEAPLQIRRHHKRQIVEAADGEDLEGQTCRIKVPKVEVVKGTCVKLMGGIRGCQTDTYLQPDHEECAEPVVE